MTHRRGFAAASLALLVAIGPGCSSIGPPSVPRDRFDYNAAIARSWQEQTLTNIVKLRYADVPLFLEVASVVAGYSLESSVDLLTTIPEPDAGATGWQFGAGGTFTDRPTITYVPILGQQFTRSFLTPIPPQSVLFLLQSGWPANLIFPVTVDSIAGHRSRIGAGPRARPADPGYERIVELLDQLQVAGVLGMRIVEQGEHERVQLVFRKVDLSAEHQAARDELRGLLGIAPDATECEVAFAPAADGPGVLAMQTRSLLQIMINLGSDVQVPAGHVAEGRVQAALPAAAGQPIFNVCSGPTPPPDVFVRVPYAGHWFWIEHGDFGSKRVFAFLMVLCSLMEKGGDEALPMVTIQA